MIHYNFSAIAGHADEMNASAGTLNGLLDDLRNYLKPLVADWEGASADAYNAAQRKWDESAAELNEILRQTSTAVHEANNRMSQINNSAAQSWA